MPPEEIAKVQEPSGLVNLGNTCYLNSVVQCLRTIEPLRKGLDQYTPSSNSANNGAGANNNASSTVFLTSLKETFNRLDRQAQALEPGMLVQATKLAFPQFAQRGPHGHPMQQDAEEFYSGLLALAAPETRGQALIERALTGPVTPKHLMGADNLVDAVFGMKMKETLTCDELSENESGMEPPVVSFDLTRKLTCNIQGGSDNSAQANVSHLAEGIELSLSGKIEKHSDVLGRNAVWSRQQRLARLPPILVVQFGRFYWKATPDSQDHAGVKCKVMKPVAFDMQMDAYNFCTPEIQAVLKVGRDKALAAEDERVNKKLSGKEGDDDAMQVEKPEEEEDEDMKAALALSMKEAEGQKDDSPAGPGLPDDFQGVYELFAVVTHKGRDADGGHYMAWVKAKQNAGEVQKIGDSDQDNDDWFVFDDDEVSPCKTEDVIKLKGGGDWHMSYLNFYRAKK
jgi:ubiquitin carboxyl-terminal hydrolase 14